MAVLEKMGVITLITGGARSGKSAFALEHAAALGARRAFIATAQALDDEMRARIERHKKERGKLWLSVEEPLEVARWLDENAGEFDVVLLDCLTLWLSNTMLDGGDVEAASKRLVCPMAEAPCLVVAVTNEGGMGIVPESALGREYRDHAGMLNQMVAREAGEVYLVVSGIPLCIKPVRIKPGRER